MREQDGSANLFLIALLYTAQTLPILFCVFGLPVILLDQGHSIEVAGLTFLLYLPLIAKVAWAPLVERYYLSALGRRKTWIVLGFTVGALLTLLLSALSPATDLPLLFAGLFILMLLYGTADVSIDALAVELLREGQSKLLTGLQTAGSYASAIIGSGVLLYIYAKAGWAATLWCLALCLAVPLLPLWRFREPVRDVTPASTATRPALRELLEFVCLPGHRAWVGALLGYGVWNVWLVLLTRPMLLKAGMSVENIGLLVGVVASLVGVPASLLGGWVLKHWTATRAFVAFNLFNVGTMLLTILIAAGIATSDLAMTLIMILAYIASSIKGGALFAMMSTQCRHDTPGTDFSIQQSTSQIGLFTAVASGFVLSQISFATLYVILAAVGLLNTWQMLSAYRRLPGGEATETATDAAFAPLPATEPGT